MEGWFSHILTDLIKIDANNPPYVINSSEQDKEPITEEQAMQKIIDIMKQD